MAQIRYIGGDRAGKGNYWNFSTGERIIMQGEGPLPGDDATLYIKASPIVILGAGPILGLLYAAFLPFIGLAIVMRVAFAKIFGNSAERLSRIATFNWSPSAAYLAGRRQKKATKQSEPDANGKQGPGKK